MVILLGLRNSVLLPSRIPRVGGRATDYWPRHTAWLDVCEQIRQIDGSLYPIPCRLFPVASLDPLWLSAHADQGQSHGIP